MADQVKVYFDRGPILVLGPVTRTFTVDEVVDVPGRGPRFGDDGRPDCQARITYIAPDRLAHAVRLDVEAADGAIEGAEAQAMRTIGVRKAA